VTVFHFELRSGIHVAHAFNLSQAELDRAVLTRWRRGEDLDFGDRRWTRDRTQLKIYAGRALDPPELSFGRGWTNAVKRGEDVTGQQLAAAASAPAGSGSPAGSRSPGGSRSRSGSGAGSGAGSIEARPPAISPALDALRREILAQCRTGPIGVHQALWLTNRWYPERRVSERLALAEAAVWGLLHERLVRLRDAAPDQADEPVDPADWEGILLDWRTWADPATPAFVIDAPPSTGS
jgi:hypothetical protein